MDQGKFSREEAEDTLDQLVQMGVLEKKGKDVRKTKEFTSIVNNRLSKLMTDEKYLENLKNYFALEDAETLANRCYDQAELLAMLDLIGGNGKTIEITKCSAVLMRMRDIQIKGGVE